MKKIITILLLICLSIIFSVTVFGADLPVPFEDDLHYTGTVGNDWTEVTVGANGLVLSWDNIANITGDVAFGGEGVITVETVNDVPESSWSMNLTWHDNSLGNGTLNFGMDVYALHGIYCEITDGQVCVGVGGQQSCGDDGPAATLGTATLSYNHTSKTAQCRNNYNGNVYNITNSGYTYSANPAQFSVKGDGPDYVSMYAEYFTYGEYDDLLAEDEGEPDPPAPSVPEFGSMTALLAMALIGTGFFFMRRREE